MQLVGLLLWLGCVICLIIVVIKMFQDKGPLHGILGLICGLYAFIWGWMNASALNLRNVMIIWTFLILASIVFNIAFGSVYSFGTR